jgi:hypothetical protein
MESSSQSFVDSQLPIVDEEGVPLKSSRIVSVAQMYALFQRAWERTRKYRLDIARIQMIIDGYPPYNPAKMEEMGLKGFANINTGLLKFYLTEGCRPLVDQVNGVETFVNVVSKEEGDEDFSEYESIVAQEHFNMVAKEPSYNFRKQELIRQYVAFGVAVPYFPDDKDWRWKSESLGNFLIDFDTPATEDEVQAAFYIRSVNPSYLVNRYHHGDDNWNKSAIKKALIAATPDKKRKDSDYISWETARKENDLYFDALLEKSEIVYSWVQENDSSISLCIFLRDNAACEEFLYKKEFIFEHQSQAFQFFTYGVGTTGTYHGIRGLGYDAANLVQEINKLVSSFIDALRIQSKMPLKITDESEIQNFQVIEKGPVMLYPSGITEMQMQTVNFAQTTVPGLNVLQSFLSQNISAYAVDQNQTNGGDARKTKAEIMANLNALAAASGGNAELFAQSWERLILEQFRRIIRKGYSEADQGGKQVKAFKKRCKDRGVPDDFWDKIVLERCSAVPPVGAGSASQQMMVMERMMEFDDRGWFDAEGSMRMHRNMITLVSNKETADSYMGVGNVGRPMQDHRNAVFENMFMAQGEPQVVYPNDNHQVHAEMHLGASGGESPISSIADHIQALQVATEQNDEETILRLAPVMEMQISHTAEHVQLMKNAPLAAQYREQLQSAAGTMVNIQRAAARIMRERAAEEQKMMEEQAAQQPVEQGRDAGQDYWQVANLAKTDMALEQNNAKFQQTFRHDEESHAQKLRIKDEETAQKLALKEAETAIKALNGRP